MPEQDQTYLIVGVGLMGGKYALELTRAGYTVTGIDRSRENLDLAIARGYIARGKTQDFTDMIAEAGHIVFALYPSDFADWVRQYRQYFRPGLIFTDVSGVKCGVVGPVQALLPPDVEFIASHPMAGYELSGVQYAGRVHFEPANFIITPTARNTPQGIAWCEALGRTLGFRRIARLSPEEHDRMIAHVSQLCHVIAVSLMCTEDRSDLASFTGDSFRDVTRIARLNETMWSELFLWNRDILLGEIEQFEGALQRLKTALVQRDRPALEEMFRLSTARRAVFETDYDGKKG